MSRPFGLAIAFVILAAGALYRAIDAARWGEGKHFWIAAGASLPLGMVAGVLFGVASQHPAANFWQNAGFGPDWECRDFGKAAAQVCARDLPKRLQIDPKPHKNEQE